LIYTTCQGPASARVPYCTPAAVDLLVERRVAVLGSDGNNYTASRGVEGV
jgi:hypothetical protein